MQKRPVLEAEDRLEQLGLMMAATGHMDPADHAKYVAELNNRAREQSPGHVDAARPGSMEELAKIGGIVVVGNT